MKNYYIFIPVLLIGLFIQQPAQAETDVALTISNDAHTITIDDYTQDDYFTETHVIEYSATSKNIQAMRIGRNDTTYILGLVWNKNVITLYLYDVKGKKISSREVFKANHDKGKDFSVVRLEAVTSNGQDLIQVRAIKLTYGQPTTLLRKRFDVQPTANHVLPLSNTYDKTITYPDFTGLDDEDAGNALFNYERLAAGLLSTQRSSALDSSCAKHNEYMRLNNILTHSEDASKPGYTEEGAAAGMQSNLGSRSNTNMSEAIIMWTTAIYHRLAMLSNGMRAYGWDVTENTSSSGKHYVCLNVSGEEDVYNFSGDDNDITYYDIELYEPIPYPGVNQGHIPTTFATGESPDPIEAFGANFPVGQPVSLTFSDNDTVSNLAMTLTDEHGQTIAGYFRAPNDPTDPNALFQGNSVTFIPKAVLHAQTTYKVKVTGTRNDADYTKEWQFRTE